MVLFWPPTYIACASELSLKSLGVCPLSVKVAILTVNLQLLHKRKTWMDEGD